jgi:hypothetical protein
LPNSVNRESPTATISWRWLGGTLEVIEYVGVSSFEGTTRPVSILEIFDWLIPVRAAKLDSNIFMHANELDARRSLGPHRQGMSRV